MSRVHLRQIIKMVKKRTANPSHLCTRQMVTTDDTKPHSAGAKKGEYNTAQYHLRSNEEEMKLWSSNGLPQSGWLGALGARMPLSGSQRLHSVK